MKSHKAGPTEQTPREPVMPANVCVYCGSATGNRTEYVKAARDLGALLGNRQIRLIFGGGSVGLMGVLADAVLDAGGKVTGVIPRGLRTAELAHEGLTEIIEVDTMHARKQRMVELADAFIALPGGIGTMDELFETWTWLQLGIHAKPVGLFNVVGYFDPLISFLGQMRDRGFLQKTHFESLIIDSNAQQLLSRLCTFTLPPARRWLAPAEGLEP